MDKLLSIIPLLIGTLTAYYAFYIYIKERNINTWPKVKGKIVESLVVMEERDDPYEDNDALYKSLVQYEYEVNGLPYKGENIGLVKFSSWQFVAQNIVRRYPVGFTVDVFYNPDSHGESYLEKDVSVLTYILLILISSICISAGIAILLSR